MSTAVLRRGAFVCGRNVVTGDADCNDLTNAINAALILQLNAGLLTNPDCQQNADINGDGRVDSVDAALVPQFVAGLLNRLPA